MKALLLLGVLLLSGCGSSEGEDGTTGARYEGRLELSVDGAFAYYAEREAERCTLERRLGACESWFCPAGSERPPERLDAGIVNIGGIELFRDLDGEYRELSFLVYPYGQEVIAEATGSISVPAHRLAVVAPAAVEFSAPVRALPVRASRASDFVTRWTPAGDGHVMVRLLGNMGAARILSCRSPVSAGEIVVPAALMEELPVPSDNVAYLFELEVSNAAARRIADWELTLTASDMILWGELIIE
jgi:hypothetical protein